jgi:tetratricopeptide (TPR) repeat protein
VIRGVYVTLLAAVLAVVLIPGLRSPVSERVQWAFQSVQRGWIDRVARGEALVEEGRYEEAVAYLENLDRRFPARSNRHSLDKERERILHALGQSYAALDRKRLTLETYRRVVEFDPRNVANHFELAAAALRFDEEAEAEQHFEHVLGIDPSHLPALDAIIGLDFERGDFARVVGRFEAYVDAFRMHDEIRIRMGDSARVVRVPIDGRSRELRVALPSVEGATRLEVESAHAGIELSEVRLEPRVRAGEVSPGRQAVPRDGPGFALLAPPWEAAAVWLTVRTRVPVDPTTWEKIAVSYRNRLDPDGFAEAENLTIRLAPQTEGVSGSAGR